MKLLLTITGLILLAISGTLLYKSYQQYINPKVVYGTWVEMQVLHDRHETLTISKEGISRNSHLVTTQFEFDGSLVSFKTGDGKFVYKWNGSEQSPQLERIEPANSVQTLIKQGYE